MSIEPHSSAFLTDDRMQSWHPDFIRLILMRASVLEARSIAEFGCGRGHWLRVLVPHLPNLKRVELIDTEPSYLETAATAMGALPQITHVGQHLHSAHQTSLEAASVDLVTCHTLLLHTPQPDLVLAEMFRVLKPGGSIIVAEPINTLNRLAISEMLHFPRHLVHEYLDICLDLAQALVAVDCDENIGRRLATLLPAAGFTESRFCQSDACNEGVSAPCGLTDAWLPSLQNLPSEERYDFTDRYARWIERFPPQTELLLTPSSVIVAHALKPATRDE
jgi:ubiquinone/menaquinone biosynthesis C-methylase UbiE